MTYTNLKKPHIRRSSSIRALVDASRNPVGLSCSLRSSAPSHDHHHHTTKREQRGRVRGRHSGHAHTRRTSNALHQSFERDHSG